MHDFPGPSGPSLAFNELYSQGAALQPAGTAHGGGQQNAPVLA